MKIAQCLGWLLIVAAPAGAAGLALTPLFEKIGVEQGLPSERVSQVVSDRQGFLWVATADGLARYDGVSFTVYRHDPADPHSLPGNDVSTVFVDRSDRVWVGTVDGGLSMLDASRRGFTTWRAYTQQANRLSGSDVWAIAQDRSGAIWAGTYAAGLNRLEHQGAAVRTLRARLGDPRSLASDTVIDLHIDARDRLWVATESGLTVIGSAQKAFDARTAVHQWLPGQMIFSLRPDERGFLWIGTRDALYRADVRADPPQAPVRYATPPLRNVEGLVEDGYGLRWLATRQGIWLETAPGAFTALRQAERASYSLPSDNILDIARDREGGIWLSTFEDGLVHVKPQWANFTLLRPWDAVGQRQQDGRVRVLSACADGSVLTDGERGELMRMDPRSGAVVHIQPGVHALPQMFYALLCASDGSYWMGHRHGVLRYDPATRGIQEWRGADGAGLGAGPVDLLREAASGDVWASALGGALYRLRAGSTRAPRYVLPSGRGQRSGHEIEDMRFDSRGRLWLAGTHGLAYWDPGSDRLQPVSHVPPGRLDALVQAGEDQLWVHSVQALSLLEVRGNRAHLRAQVDASHGLPLVNASGLFRGPDQSLWLTSGRGVWRVTTGAFPGVRGYGRADGLFPAELSQRTAAQAGDCIFVGSRLGLVGFDPIRLRQNEVPPLLALVELSVLRDGRRTLLPPAQAVTLGYRDRDLRIGVRALSLADPSSNRYRFKLEGVDPQWVEHASHGQREFPQLPAGRYVLYAAAANSSGVWGAVPVRIPIEVRPPPWRTGYAWAAYALAAFALWWWLQTGYQRRLRRQHALDLALARSRDAERHNEAKSRFLADIGHEIRTPMSGVIGMAELLSRSPLEAQQRSYVQAVLHSGQHVLKLVNDLLDLSRIEAGRLMLEPEATDLAALLREVEAFHQPLAQTRGLEWRMHLDPSLARWVLVDAARLQQILFNLLGNALKFTRQGHIHLDVSRGDAGQNNVAFRVADSGEGLSPAHLARLFQRYAQTQPRQHQQGSGLGLAIVKQLVQLMDGQVAVESRLGHGTQFRIQLPLPPVTARVGAGAGVLAVPSAARSVLLVEDDETLRTALRQLLQLEGHRVQVAAHALEALTRMEEGVFDLALLDLDLPHMDGFRLATLLRRKLADRGHSMPLIAISANPRADVEQRCLAAGFARFLRKPITASVLHQAVAQAGREG